MSRATVCRCGAGHENIADVGETRMPAVPEPFTIAVPDDVLDDLQQRLARVRWPDEIPGSAWQYGSNLAISKS
ncbi:hypothetical protein NKDENANG_03592 [Candidatus Entotheonellaceae bacterium PAL068K]